MAQAHERTYLPEPDDELDELLAFFEMRPRSAEAAVEPQFFLTGDGRCVELPEAFHRVLVQVLEAMKAGKAVTVAPQGQCLTTQQAADLLGVSRPTVVKLIDEGVLPASVPGRARRMVKLDDLLAYRERRRDAQYRALIETSVDDNEEPEPAEVAQERFRRVRAEVAAERRAARNSTR